MLPEIVFCSDVTPGKGRLAKCLLLEQVNEVGNSEGRSVSESCKYELKSFQYDRATNINVNIPYCPGLQGEHRGALRRHHRGRWRGRHHPDPELPEEEEVPDLPDAGQFDLADEKEVSTVRALILGHGSAALAEGEAEDAEAKPGSICIQYFGTNASTQTPDQQESGKERAQNLLLFYAVLPGGIEEGGGWRCGYGHVDWHKLCDLKDFLVEAERGLEVASATEEGEEEEEEAALKTLRRVLQAAAKVLLFVGSDQDADKAEPSHVRKTISELSRVEPAVEGEPAMDKAKVLSIFNQVKAMLDASVGIDIVHPWLANWLARVLDAQQTKKQGGSG